MGNYRSLAQNVGPLFGLFYVVIGIAGFFVTGFKDFTVNTDDAIAGFSINPMHNLAHLGIGLFLIIMTTAWSAAVAEGAVLGVGLFYIVATAIGVLDGDNLTILSMDGRDDLENLNHIVNGLALFTLGLISVGATEAHTKRTGQPAH